MKSSEIKELTTQEVAEKIEAEKAALTRMKLNHAITPLENPQEIKVTRRNVAKLMTEMRRRQLTEK